ATPLTVRNPDSVDLAQPADWRHLGFRQLAAWLDAELPEEGIDVAEVVGGLEGVLLQDLQVREPAALAVDLDFDRRQRVLDVDLGGSRPPLLAGGTAELRQGIGGRELPAALGVPLRIPEEAPAGQPLRHQGGPLVNIEQAL